MAKEDKLYVQPILLVWTNQLRAFEGKSFFELHKTFDEMRRLAKTITNYNWDNGHLFIGKVVDQLLIQISFHPDGSGYSLWNKKTGTALVTPTHAVKFWSDKDSEYLKNYADNIEAGYVQCLECSGWTKEWHHYSFAGAVCNEHYDPKVHVPPDTSGD